MSPKKARTVYIVIYAIAIVLMLGVYILDKSNKYKLILPFVFAAGAAMIIGGFIEMAFWRCEHCGKYLGRQKFIGYCPHCGMPIE